MSLQEARIDSFPYELSEQERRLYPCPVDRKILGGLALDSLEQAELSAELQERLDSALSDIEDGNLDPRKEHGVCLAYGVRVDPESVTDIDNQLLRAAEESGALGDKVLRAAGVLWCGTVGSRNVFLYRYNGPLMLSDGTSPDAVVYSVLSARSRV